MEEMPTVRVSQESQVVNKSKKTIPLEKKLRDSNVESEEDLKEFQNLEQMAKDELLSK